MNFDPNNLCLESQEFGSVPLVLHSSGHLLLSLVNPSNTLEQFTVMIDFQSSSSSICTDFQKRDEQTMGSLQPRNQVADKTAEPDEVRAADSSVVTGGSDPPDDFPVSLDEPDEEITEQWHDDLHEWYICQEFPEQLRRVIVRIHTNLGHPQNSTAGGSEEMIKCAIRYPCSVCKRKSRPRLRRPVSVPRTRLFNDTLLAVVHFWNYQGREVLVYSMIDEATCFHVTQILPSQISSRPV